MAEEWSTTIISMIEWIRTSRLSIKKSLFWRGNLDDGGESGGCLDSPFSRCLRRVQRRPVSLSRHGHSFSLSSSLSLSHTHTHTHTPTHTLSPCRNIERRVSGQPILALPPTCAASTCFVDSDGEVSRGETMMSIRRARWVSGPPEPRAF